MPQALGGDVFLAKAGPDKLRVAGIQGKNRFI
jgi:hypothetical protein